MPAATIGRMVEQLVIQTPTPQAFTLASLTRSSTTATATTNAAHGYSTGDYVTIAQASPDGYNGKVKITVTSTTVFTYTVSSGLSTPATGTITATYQSNPVGGRAVTFRELDTIWAEMLPIGTSERLQAKAISAQTTYRFRVYARHDITPTMQAVWTPTWPPSATAKTLEIHGVLPHEDGRTFMVLECGAL